VCRIGGGARAIPWRYGFSTLLFREWVREKQRDAGAGGAPAHRRLGRDLVGLYDRDCAARMVADITILRPGYVTPLQVRRARFSFRSRRGLRFKEPAQGSLRPPLSTSRSDEGREHTGNLPGSAYCRQLTLQ